MTEREIIDLLTGDIAKETSKSGAKEQNITIRDATSETAKVLVKEWGSDENYKAQGKVDVRRFSDVSDVDVYWLMYFQNVPDNVGGIYSKQICEAFLNDRYSVGGRHKKMTIEFQDSISSEDKDRNRKDKRNFIQRHITHRDEPIYDDEK